jgi:hypothetical protein
MNERLPPPVLARIKHVARSAAGALCRVSYLRTRWPPPIGSRPPAELAVCCIFRNEARYLAEWVTFHRLQGVTRFYLYDNRSTDEWKGELEREITSGAVEVTPWPEEPGQHAAYVDCLERHRADSRWIAFIDADEFLFSPTGRQLPDVLRTFESHPGVVVNWRCYGPNGWDQAPDGLVIENYVRRAPDDDPNNKFVKSIVFPRRTIGPSESPHYFRYRRWAAVGEDSRPVYWSRREAETADLLRINHYFAKSQMALEQKVARPTAWDGVVGECGVGSWSVLPSDQVEDKVILRYAPAVRAALSQRRARSFARRG